MAKESQGAVHEFRVTPLMPVGPQSPRVYSAGIQALLVILDPPTTPEPLSLSVAPTSFLGHFQEIPFFPLRAESLRIPQYRWRHALTSSGLL